MTGARWVKGAAGGRLEGEEGSGEDSKVTRNEDVGMQGVGSHSHGSRQGEQVQSRHVDHLATFVRRERMGLGYKEATWEVPWGGRGGPKPEPQKPRGGGEECDQAGQNMLFDYKLGKRKGSMIC